MVTLEKILLELSAGNDADFTGFTLADLIRAEHYCRLKWDEFKDASSRWQALYDHMSINIVPKKMEDEGVEATKIEGVGRVNLRGDMWTSTQNAELLAEWLKEHDFGDLLKEAVNGSTLKAFIKEQMGRKDGLVPPGDLVKVTPYTRAVITKG